MIRCEREPVQCIDCGAGNVRAVFVREPKDSNCTSRIDDAPYWNDSSYVILRCTDCGSVFLHPHYFEESFSVYTTQRYFNGYYPNNIHSGGGPDLGVGPLGKLQESVRRRNKLKKALTLLRVAGKTGGSRPTVLEIGCAQGGLAQAFAEMGCEAYGIDLSEEAACAAKKRGIKVFCGRFEDYDCPDETFDLIVSIETLEHMGNISEFLAQIVRKLKPDGAFVFEVPNDLEGYRARVYPWIWWMIPPMHIRYFTPRNVRGILLRHGLYVSAVRTRGSVGADVAAICSWLSKKLHLDSLPFYSKFRVVFTYAVRIVFAPLDWMLNGLRLNSELVVIATREKGLDT